MYSIISSTPSWSIDRPAKVGHVQGGNAKGVQIEDVGLVGRFEQLRRHRGDCLPFILQALFEKLRRDDKLFGSQWHCVRTRFSISRASRRRNKRQERQQRASRQP